MDVEEADTEWTARAKAAERDKAVAENEKLRRIILSALDCLNHDDKAGALKALRKS